MTRSELLQQLAVPQRFDLAVIGGGATGLGVALEASQRGYKVVLLESHDFAKGTSSRSTKLVHGGVRYLAQGNISLVREALHERSVLLHDAPHLAQPIPFVMPSYRWWETAFYGIGLKLYDLLAGADGLGPTEFLSARSVLARMPGLKSKGFTLAAGEVVTRSFEIYAGPKELPLLRKLGATQDKVMNFGMFGFVSEFLLWSMNGLHGLLGNYAASIIVLTILIKSVLWPVQNKATKEMRKMAALSPKMTEMREKHKDNPQKLNEETMKLYKEYGVNPFSGCLPMLIQIPIFFGFYAMLGTAIELRNSSFFWVVDLSQPDTITHLLGFPINILPLLMAGTMVWQMIITPKTGDAMQQRIFYFMPIIFLVFCYNYASGLALYWTTQNLFSIVQLYFTRNQPLPTLEKKSIIAKREALQAKKKSKKPPTP